MNQCPDCSGPVRLGWINGDRVCVHGHRWNVDSDGTETE